MKFLRLSFTLLFYVKYSLLAEEKSSPNPPDKSGSPKELFDQVCAICHGKTGEGSDALKAPAIAGLPDWYTLLQIEKFRNDLRGSNPEDKPGQIMHNLARSIDDKQFKGVAELIAAMPMHPTQNKLGGDAEQGKEVFTEICAKCHRFNGKGERTFGSAPLIGLQDWYIRAQISKFRDGIRGGSKADEKGFKMHEMARYLSEKNASDVTAHIAILAKKYANTKSRREREYEELQKKKEQKEAKQNAIPEEFHE